MHQAFSMKELGHLSYFLGISVETSGFAYVLSQKKYAQDVLTKVGMLDCKPCASPISVKPSLPHNSDVPFPNPSFYRGIMLHIQLLITKMHQAFSMKELGHLSYFLGISVETSGFAYVLSQKKYAQDVLTKAGMLDCKPCASPISVKPGLPHNSDVPFPNPSFYRGCSSILKELCRLTYTPSSFALQAYSDSNWAGDSVDRKSTSGYCIFLGSNLISWSAKKQATVSRSFIEAEYRSLAHTAVELTWIGMLLHDLCIVSPTIPLLRCDNVSTIALASNPVFHSQSKHIN
ncbi:uncharacterized protein LOC114267200 [Camellia sinensis]|uniref:uncharacterized protein LOC114267200 n=1 Tax=Camellia sinensis TaxID=4442 RepID=UPI0010359407|nr:uncharacterized protein LOC114267200 [Camellia sinensis]